MENGVKNLRSRTREILQQFVSRKGEEVSIQDLLVKFPDMKRENLQYAVISLQRKGHKFQVLDRGQLWIYKGFRNPRNAKEKRQDELARRPLVAQDVANSQIQDEPEFQQAPAAETHGNFQVMGVLMDGPFPKGTVVRITSPGWSDRPHLITEL